MGPNLYITPPGSFTDFHQDGHGTVDSGHQCLAGYNEVIMLRRMTEAHKQKAIYILKGKDPLYYDALYGLPHSEGAVSFCSKSLVRYRDSSSKYLFLRHCPHFNFYLRGYCAISANQDASVAEQL